MNACHLNGAGPARLDPPRVTLFEKCPSSEQHPRKRVKTLAKSHLRLITPTAEKRTVTPARRPNADLRTREYLTTAEVERLLKATKGNRWSHRDSTMILVAYRHGLRASELTDLRWDQVDFPTATLHVRRVKQGSPSTHPILGDELRCLRRLQREQDPKSPFVFTSERGSPFTTAGFARMVEPCGRAGEARLQGASPHAAACLRLRSGKRGPRHPGAASLFGTSQYSAHRAVHRAGSRAVQTFLEGLIWVRNTVRCQDPRLTQD